MSQGETLKEELTGVPKGLGKRALTGRCSDDVYDAKYSSLRAYRERG